MGSKRVIVIFKKIKTLNDGYNINNDMIEINIKTITRK